MSDTVVREAVSILVVEDFDPLRRLTVRVLTMEGYECLEAANASTAVALCDRHDFDLVITDYAVPGGDGIEIARTGLAKNPSLKVLIVSGSAESALDLSLPRGRAAFLGKPFDIDVLVARVQDLLRA